MWQYNRKLQIALLLAVSQLIAAAANNQVESHDGLIAWLKSNHGEMHPNLEIRAEDPTDPESKIIGLFAKKAISAESPLIYIPKSIMIQSDEHDDDDITTLACNTVRNLVRELELHDKQKSSFAPYMQYLLNHHPVATPSAWSHYGQNFLHAILSEDQDSNFVQNFLFPPEYPTDWISDDWTEGCNGGSPGTPVETLAALLVVQKAVGIKHSSDQGPSAAMIPIYDIIKHQNANSRNRNADIRFDGVRETFTGAEIYATKDISEGEEIFAPTCHKEHLVDENGFGFYGTPEIFRDCGIVEDYPQLWHFPFASNLAFEVDISHEEKTEASDDAQDPKIFITQFISGRRKGPTTQQMRGMRTLYDNLREVKIDLIRTAQDHPDLPQAEWDAIQSYVYAMETAILAALNHENDCIQSGICSSTSFFDRYGDLQHQQLKFLYDDGSDDPPTCDDELQSEPFEDGTFETLEVIKSPYQTLTYMWNPQNRDTCLDIDYTIQICDSYRPHYHELSVHNAARYIPNPRRFLWVGGGDSMLLHEFLKYPNLELAVGLELDQRVPRSSFKHFGAQPHFDNDKVQWWFGDATKSIMMLPKEYFGSFDMIVVDLSETVMSFSVTEELDIVEALTLLLKPDGIFVKNEIYFGKFKQLFPQSVQIHWYDNPFVCSQVMVMGSRGIDFMNPNLTDHGVKGLLIEPFHEIEDPYHLYHDFGRNDNPHKICDSLLNKENKGDESEQTNSPGILFIIESENATIDLSDVNQVNDAITSSLERSGIPAVVHFSESSDGNHISFFELKDGYIVSRCMPEYKYCGFDIHFWSNIGKHEVAKKSVTDAVGSANSSISAYRIIAGGLFGLPSWRQSEKLRGPQFDVICHDAAHIGNEESQELEPEDFDEKMSTDHRTSIVKDSLVESVTLIDGKHKRIALLVGNGAENNEADRGELEVLNNIEDVDQVHLFNCPEMSNFNEYEKDSLNRAISCEKHLKESLERFSKDKKFDILIVGTTADMNTASILLKVFSSQYNSPTENAFESNLLILSTSPASPNIELDQNWHGPLVQLFKNEVFVDEPATYSEIVIRRHDDNSGGIKLLLANNGDDHFIQRLNTTMINFQEKSGYIVEFQMVDGGRYLMQENFVPTHHFLPDHYNQEEPLRQWESQQPLGHQILFQMELGKTSPVPNPLSKDFLYSRLEYAISKSSIPGLKGTAAYATSSYGDGLLLVNIWSGGSITVLWDGRAHVDVNLFTYENHASKAKSFEANFRFESGLKTILRDEQPRGVGRVVSYLKDLEDYETPHWA